MQLSFAAAHKLRMADLKGFTLPDRGCLAISNCVVLAEQNLHILKTAGHRCEQFRSHRFPVSAARKPLRSISTGIVGAAVDTTGPHSQQWPYLSAKRLHRRFGGRVRRCWCYHRTIFIVRDFTDMLGRASVSSWTATVSPHDRRLNASTPVIARYYDNRSWSLNGVVQATFIGGWNVISFISTFEGWVLIENW